MEGITTMYYTSVSVFFGQDDILRAGCQPALFGCGFRRGRLTIGRSLTSSPTKPHSRNQTYELSQATWSRASPDVLTTQETPHACRLAGKTAFPTTLLDVSSYPNYSFPSS